MGRKFFITHLTQHCDLLGTFKHRHQHCATTANNVGPKNFGSWCERLHGLFLIYNAVNINAYLILHTFINLCIFCKQTFDLNFAECPVLNKPKNGKRSCRKVSGKMLCILSCDEGYSFSAEAITKYTCGPDTEWKWNGDNGVSVPTCLST